MLYDRREEYPVLTLKIRGVRNAIHWAGHIAIVDTAIQPILSLVPYLGLTSFVPFPLPPSHMFKYLPDGSVRWMFATAGISVERFHRMGAYISRIKSRVLCAAVLSYGTL